MRLRWCGWGLVSQEEGKGIAEGLAKTDANGEHSGQYSDAVLNELESQNEQQVEGIMGKVKLLKDVSPPFSSLFPPFIPPPH